MISASDVPACPACGSREVHPVVQADGPTLYACRQCGRDQTQAWEAVQPGDRPEPEPVIADTFVPPPDQETIRDACLRLGVGATVKLEGQT